MTKPAERDLDCYRGQSYEQNLYFLLSGDRTPIDLTGTVWKSQIKMHENTKASVADFDVVVTPTEGKVSLMLSEAVTSKLRDGAYYWDVRTEGEHGDVDYYVKGKFIVSGRTTTP